MVAALDLTVAGVLFDMDGTLVDSTAVVERVWTDFAQTYGLDAGEVLRYAHGRQSVDSVTHFLPPGQDLGEVTARLDARELVELDGVVEVPGAAALLRALRAWPVAVVTSASRELAERRMRAAGIEPPDVLVCAGDVAVGKPAPDGYLAAAAQLGVPPGDCAVFEDAETGLRAAVASGGRVVVVGGHVSNTTAGLPRVPDLIGLTASPAGSGSAAELGAGSGGWVRLMHP